MGERDSLTVPFRRPRLIGTPAGIGKDMRHSLPAIILHHIDFSIRRPVHAATQKPDGRPGSTRCRNLCPNLYPAIEKLLLLCRIHRSRGIMNLLDVLRPSATVLPEPGISAILLLLAGHDYEIAILAIGIGFLIPLRLVVALESLLVVPHLGIEKSIGIELIAPYQFPVILSHHGRWRQSHR